MTVNVTDAVSRPVHCNYPVGHKKSATLLWTIISAFLNGFQQLMHQWKKE